MKARTATGPLAWYMRLFGFLGWTTFWSTLHILPGYENNQPLPRHERCHLEQIKRDSRPNFAQ